jgi:uncharacterized membrane protein
MPVWGLAVTAVGASHFGMPDAFASVNRLAFGRHDRVHSYANGAIETLIGLGLSHRKTRRLALAGALPYSLYLGINVVRTRNRQLETTAAG